MSFRSTSKTSRQRTQQRIVVAGVHGQEAGMKPAANTHVIACDPGRPGL